MDGGSTSNEAVMRRYLQAWETGDRGLFEEVLAPGFVDYMYGKPRSRDMLLEQATSGDVAAQDRKLTIDELVSQGDTVIVRMRSSFTYALTGQRIEITGMIWARIVNGLMVEGWGEHDRLGQLQQVGVVPEDAELRDWVRAQLGE